MSDKKGQSEMTEDLKSVIKNLENLNVSALEENGRLMERVDNLEAELKHQRNFMMDEQNRMRYNDTRIKRLYHDSIFFKDLINK